MEFQRWAGESEHVPVTVKLPVRHLARPKRRPLDIGAFSDGQVHTGSWNEGEMVSPVVSQVGAARVSLESASIRLGTGDGCLTFGKDRATTAPVLVNTL